MIPYGKQDINQCDIDAVIAVLNSDFLTQGPQVPLFEAAVANYCGVQSAIAVNSATSGLHIACLALGLGEGDWLWTSPNTFVASANCGLYCGAKVDFVDIDLQTYNLCVVALEEKLIEAQAKNKLPKIVIPVHFAGQSCDMKRIYELSQLYGFKIIEDASHAIGGQYLGLPIGGCQYSDITVFSFHPVKIITTAEGGMALTNNSALAERMSLFRSHGITRDENLMTHESDGPWYYQQVLLGYNYRMTELQAALGVSQLTRLDSFVGKRNELARSYDEQLNDLALLTPWQHPSGYSSRHLYVIRLKLNEIRRSHYEVFQYLRSQGIGVNLHYIPVHTQPYYQAMGFSPGDFPESERYYSESISLPMHAGLSSQEKDQVISALKEAISK